MTKAALTPTYTGPFQVLQRNDKFFKLNVNGKAQNVTIDRLKPAEYDAAARKNSNDFYIDLPIRSGTRETATLPIMVRPKKFRDLQHIMSKLLGQIETNDRDTDLLANHIDKVRERMNKRKPPSTDPPTTPPQSVLTPIQPVASSTPPIHVKIDQSVTTVTPPDRSTTPIQPNAQQVTVDVNSPDPPPVGNKISAGSYDPPPTHIQRPSDFQSRKVSDEIGPRSTEHIGASPVFIYSDLIKTRCVGSANARYLRVLPAVASLGTYHTQFRNIEYCPLERTYLENVSVFITDMYGAQVKFAASEIPIYIMLHFKQMPVTNSSNSSFYM